MMSDAQCQRQRLMGTVQQIQETRSTRRDSSSGGDGGTADFPNDRRKKGSSKPHRDPLDENARLQDRVHHLEEEVLLNMS